MYSSLDLPHPGRSAVAFGTLVAAALALDLAPRLPWTAGVVAAGSFGVAGVIRTMHDRRELAAVRRTADRLIVQSPAGRDASELVRWRSAELTSRSCRDALVRTLHSLSASLDERLLPSASPVRRVAARAERDLLASLEQRLADERPLAARGVLLTRTLLCDAASPLYSEETEHLLAVAVRRALGALEP